MRQQWGSRTLSAFWRRRRADSLSLHGVSPNQSLVLVEIASPTGTARNDMDNYYLDNSGKIRKIAVILLINL